jgi:hypothetical protein
MQMPTKKTTRAATKGAAAPARPQNLDASAERLPASQQPSRATRMSGMRTARAGLRDERAAARDAFCVASNGYPGRPADWLYRSSETCVRADAARRAEERVAWRAARGAPSLQQTQREAQTLQRVLGDEYGDVVPSHENGVQPELLSIAVGKMVDPKRRLAQPDPLKRYTEIEVALRKAVPRLGFAARFLTLKTTKHALDAMLAARAPTVRQNGRVPRRP